jgi:hypothetical protein
MMCGGWRRRLLGRVLCVRGEVVCGIGVLRGVFVVEEIGVDWLCFMGF